jgi:hypothetical protein
MVSLFGSTKFRTKRKLAGRWRQHWDVDSANFPSIADRSDSEVEITQFNSRIKGTFNAKDESYHLLGRIDRDLYVTGIWRNVESGNTYHGSFQLKVAVGEKTMTGQWIGFSATEDKVKNGAWVWERCD